MCSSYAESLMCACQCAEHLSRFLYGEAVLAEVGAALYVRLVCAGVYTQALLRVAASVRYLVYVLLVVEECAFAFELLCKF